MASLAILLVLVAIVGDEALAQERNYIRQADKTLVLTNIIFRHGDRTPEDMTVYPNAPYTNDRFFPYNYGELTTKGQARMIRIGRKLRARYGRFLGDIYYTDLVWSSTSDYARTQSSLQSLHAGLFMTIKQNPIPGFPWQAIPYHVYAHPDNVIATWRARPERLSNVTFPPPQPSTQELFEYLRLHSGYPNVSYVEAMLILDYTKVSLENGFPVPAWLRPVYPHPLSEVGIRTFEYLARDAVRNGWAALLQKIIRDAIAKSTGSLLPTARKMFLYSGHDMNIHSTLAALNVWLPEAVDYGAHILLELHDVDGVHGFKIYYDNDRELETLVVPGCGTFCPLDEFRQRSDVDVRAIRHVQNCQNYPVEMHQPDTLLLATVLFRHGDRTPDVQNTTPANPYKNFSFYPYKLGELTHKGQSRMIKVGAELRQRYKDFLGSEFYTDMVTSTTSSYTRCQMSLQCVHAGLFPPSDRHVEDLELPWQAVPFDVIPFDEDNFISIHMRCPQVMEDIDPSDIPPEDYMPLKYVSEQAGYDDVQYINAMRTYDFYRTCVEAGLELPEWIRPLWPEEVRSLAQRFWHHFQEKRRRVGAVPLLKRIADEAQLKIDEGDVPYPKKMYLYACHDMNLHLLRGAMQIWTDEPVGYGAYLIVELHKIDEEHGFKIYFQNGYDAPRLMTIPGYPEFVTVRDFAKVTDLADVQDILEELAI